MSYAKAALSTTPNNLPFFRRKVSQRTFVPTVPIYFGEAFEIPKDFLQKVLCVRGLGRTPQLTFLERKVSQRISRRLHHFILAKLLRFQRTFYKKSFVSGFGAEAPTDNAHKKHGNAVLFIFHNVSELP